MCIEKQVGGPFINRDEYGVSDSTACNTVPGENGLDKHLGTEDPDA
jgi:hypothetical protein